ncbi:MAG: septum formation family protein, partial [Actinomycetota bacterium]
GLDALGDTAAETAGSLGSVAGQGCDALGDTAAETAGSLGSVAGQGFDALGDATAETADPLGSAADAATIAFERDGVPGSTALSRPVEQPGGASAVPVDRAPAEDGQTGPSLAAETAFISPPSGPPGVDGLAPPPPTGVGLGEVPTVPPPDSYPAPSVPAPAGPGVGGLPSAPGSGFGEPPPAPPQDFLGGAGAAAPPPALTPERSRLPWIILGIVALAAFALILFLVLRPSDQTSVASITQGQCFADFGQFQGDEVRTSVSSADCTEPHALEVFDVTSSPYAGFDDYPGNQIIEDLAFEHCLSGFEPFVGIAYGESVLDVWALYPTEGSWTITGDREVVCMVGQADESLTTGTLEGSGR